VAKPESGSADTIDATELIWTKVFAIKIQMGNRKFIRAPHLKHLVSVVAATATTSEVAGITGIWVARITGVRAELGADTRPGC
jgi:hypothetical protein